MSSAVTEARRPVAPGHGATAAPSCCEGRIFGPLGTSGHWNNQISIIYLPISTVVTKIYIYFHNCFTLTKRSKLVLSVSRRIVKSIFSRLTELKVPARRSFSTKQRNDFWDQCYIFKNIPRNHRHLCKSILSARKCPSRSSISRRNAPIFVFPLNYYQFIKNSSVQRRACKYLFQDKFFVY